MIRSLHDHQLVRDTQLVECAFQGVRVGETDEAVGGAVDGDCRGKRWVGSVRGLVLFMREAILPVGVGRGVVSSCDNWKTTLGVGNMRRGRLTFFQQ